MGFVKMKSLALSRKSEYYLQKEIFGRYQVSNLVFFNVGNCLNSWDCDAIQNMVMHSSKAKLKIAKSR